LFTASRLTVARKRRGLTLVEVGDRAGITAQSVSNYENGRQVPSAQVLDRLAEALRFPVSFFHAPELDLITVDQVSFRARSKLSARKREVALSVGQLAIEFHDWMSKLYHLPPPDLPSLNKPDPETAAGIVRARWNLGSAPIGNIVHLLESHGVRVFSLAPEYSDVDAFSFYNDGVPFVFLNTMKTAERGRFDAAHELGHLVLHGQGRDLARVQAEQEANDFASAFLMPRESVVAHMPASPLVDQILTGKKIWNVAALALAYRLHDIGMLSDWHYRTTCIELGRRGYKTKELGGTQRESSQLLTKVFLSLRRKEVTVSDIARELSISPEDLNNYVFGLVITALEGQDVGHGQVSRPTLRLVETGVRSNHEASQVQPCQRCDLA
jgi:Zn-dependent peptidase ImmA (M78 family)/DNA-binding XRE family transcriptional regulator